MRSYKITIFLTIASIAALHLPQNHLFAFQDPIYFSRLTVDDGLLQNEITCLLQDRKKFIWIGTRGGVNKFDGYQFKVLNANPNDKNSLVNNSIEAMFEDRAGHIWIGTKVGGISIYDPKFDRFSNFQNEIGDTRSLSENRIISFEQDDLGNMWIGTWGGGLNRFVPEDSTFLHFLHGDIISDILSDNSGLYREGTIWIGTYSGLYRFDPYRETFLHYGSDITIDQEWDFGAGITSLCLDSINKKLWIGTWNAGLQVFDLKNETLKKYRHFPNNPNSLSSNDIYRVFQSKSGQIWAGSWGFGLNAYNPVKDQFIRIMHNVGKPESLSNDIILSFMEDDAGTLWIGTDGGGINKYDKNLKKFTHIYHHSDDPFSLTKYYLLSIFEDSQERIWIGSEGGGLQMMIDPEDPLKGFLTFTRDPTDETSISCNTIEEIYEDPDHQIWVGANGITPGEGGLLKLSWDKTLNKPFFQKFLHNPSDSHSISGNKITAILEDRFGILWVGTQQNGLNRVIGSSQQAGLLQFKRYQANKNNPNTLQHNRITQIYEDSHGHLWIGTYGGLHRYDYQNDKFQHFKNIPGNPSSLCSNIIITIHESTFKGESTLWIGTSNGLAKMSNTSSRHRADQSFESFFVHDGLLNDYINAILEDDFGNLWISTNKGISKFDPQRNLFINYDINDGLQSNEFTERCGFKTRDGRMLFGGINGLNVFHPDQIEENLHIPQIVLTDLKIFNQSIRVGQAFKNKVLLNQSIQYIDHITLTYRENAFTLEFAALDYTDPKMNRFAYQLKGFNHNWIRGGNSRSVTYTNLSPNEYIFTVLGSNNDGNWNYEGVSLNITVLPPFWKTWWAYSSYVLIFIGILYLFQNQLLQWSRLKHKLEIEQVKHDKDNELIKLKLKFFSHMAHELRTPLTLILGPLERMIKGQEGSPRIHRNHLLMEKNAKRLLKLTNRLLDFQKFHAHNFTLKVVELNVVQFLRETSLAFRYHAQKNQILFVFKSVENEILVWCDRDKLENIIYNLLANSFKFTPASGEVHLELRKTTTGAIAQISQEPDIGNVATFGQLPENVNDLLEIEVRDTGCGISGEKLTSLFNQYFQEEKNIMTRSGIGLEIVKNFIELHYGRIFISSIEDIGTRFLIWLPLGNKHLQDSEMIKDYKGSEHVDHYKIKKEEIKQKYVLVEDSDSEESNVSKPVLLVVEDNAEIRTFLKDHFQATYQVETASDGIEGFILAETTMPDLIISDIMMPGMDGLELCSKIKEDEKTSHIPVILLTARSSLISKTEGFEIGADDYIVKPFDRRILDARVRNLINSRKNLRKKYGSDLSLKPKDLTFTETDERFLERIIGVIESKMQSGHLKVSDIAKEIGMSHSLLYKKIIALTDLTVVEFIRSVRLKKAAILLAHSNITVAEASYEVGFSDPKYFSKCFYALFGQTPSAFISKNRSKIK